MSYIFIIETDELLWQINRKLDMHNIIKVCLCVWKEWLFVLQCKSTSIKQSFCTASLYCVGMSFLSNKDKSTLIIMPKPWSTPAVMHDASHTPLSLTSSVSAAFLSLIKTANGSIHKYVKEHIVLLNRLSSSSSSDQVSPMYCILHETCQQYL